MSNKLFISIEFKSEGLATYVTELNFKLAVAVEITTILPKPYWLRC